MHVREGALSWRRAAQEESLTDWEVCRDNKVEFEGFLGEEFDAYCTSMERPGIWGDELTLVSAHPILRAVTA